MTGSSSVIFHGKLKKERIGPFLKIPGPEKLQFCNCFAEICELPGETSPWSYPCFVVKGDADRKFRENNKPESCKEKFYSGIRANESFISRICPSRFYFKADDI